MYNNLVYIIICWIFLIVTVCIFFFSIKKSNKRIATILQKECSQEDRTNYFGLADSLFTRLVCRLLVQGLQGRIMELGYNLEPEVQWSVGTKWPRSNSTLLIGIRLNPELAYSVIEKGPPANEPEVCNIYIYSFSISSS